VYALAADDPPREEAAVSQDISIQFTRFSAFYSPLIATIAGGFLGEEGLTPRHSVAPAGMDGFFLTARAPDATATRTWWPRRSEWGAETAPHPPSTTVSPEESERWRTC
jgi:hypothetical protein